MDFLIFSFFGCFLFFAIRTRRIEDILRSDYLSQTGIDVYIPWLLFYSIMIGASLTLFLGTVLLETLS